MQITVKNLTSGPISLPGILPRLSKSQEITVDITPEDFDAIRVPLAALRDAVVIEFGIELAGSISNEFTFDDELGLLLYKGSHGSQR